MHRTRRNVDRADGDGSVSRISAEAGIGFYRLIGRRRSLRAATGEP
jgi:hypothetical protein